MKDRVAFARKAQPESISRPIDVDFAARWHEAAKLVALLRDAGLDCELVGPDSDDLAARFAEQRH
jgi:hypothetical protein